MRPTHLRETGSDGAMPAEDPQIRVKIGNLTDRASAVRAGISYIPAASQVVPAVLGAASTAAGAVAAVAVGLGAAAVPASVVAISVAAAISGIVAQQIKRLSKKDDAE